MLGDVRVRTERAIADGLTLEEFLASDPTADYDDAWGQGFLNPRAVSHHRLPRPSGVAGRSWDCIFQNDQSG
ncbi:MAG: hypothetical protein ACFB5Z_17145 [Elainellaceae cyanobacterium]